MDFSMFCSIARSVMPSLIASDNMSDNMGCYLNLWLCDPKYSTTYLCLCFMVCLS